MNSIRCLTYGCLFLSLLCTSCLRLGPDICCPESRVACEWERGEAFVSDSAEHSGWWEDFDDPVLSCLVETAYERNLPIEMACERIQQARAELGIATGMLFPQTQRAFGKHLKGQVSANVMPLSLLPEDVRSRVNRVGDLWSVSFEVAWELDLWGRFRRMIEGAGQNYCAAVADYHAKMAMVFSEVGQAYVSVRLFEELYEIASRHQGLSARTLEIAEVRHRFQEATEVELLRARQAAYDTEALVPGIAEGLEHARNALCLLLGFTPGELDCILKDSDGIPVSPESVAVGVPADLLRRRPDIREAEHRAMVAGTRIGVAKAALLPHFALLGTLGYETAKRGTLFGGGSLYWAYGPVVDWDIFNYGRLTNQVHLEESFYREALLRYEQQVLLAQSEVDDAMASFIHSRERAGAYDQSVVAAERASDLAWTEYQFGELDLKEVLDRQAAWLGEQKKQARARADIAVGLIHIYKALGGGWQRDSGLLCEEDE